jgi:hypothetical protein
MYNICHTTTVPVNLNPANENLVSLKLTAAAAVAISDEGKS